MHEWRGGRDWGGEDWLIGLLPPVVGEIVVAGVNDNDFTCSQIIGQVESKLGLTVNWNEARLSHPEADAEHVVGGTGWASECDLELVNLISTVAGLLDTR